MTVFKNTIWLALFIALGLAAPETALSKNLTPITSLQPPPWPLPPLNRQEREARLKFVMDTQNYQVSKARAPMTGPECQNLLKTLKDPTAIHILDPDVIAQSRDDAKVPDNLIRRCPTVEFDRVWYSWKEGPLDGGVDPVFDVLPLDQKDKVADYYARKTGPIEFYDVSRFFSGKKTWGTFTEAGELVCNSQDDKACIGKEGYRLSSGIVVGPVVDAETCSQHLFSKVKTNGRMFVNTAYPYAFRELPTFYAYAEIDKALYRLGLSTVYPVGDLYRLLHGAGTTLIAEPANVQKGGLCMFETKPQKKGD